MISIEAYRAAIGRYYNRSKHVNKVHSQFQNDCYCKIYDSLAEECSTTGETSNHTDFVHRFQKYLRRCFESIIFEIRSTDLSEFEYGFYNHLFDCYGKILNVVDDPSYFKSLKFLLDGDNCTSSEFDTKEDKCFGETSKQDTHVKHATSDLPDIDINFMKRDTFSEISYSVTAVKGQQKTSNEEINLDLYNTTFLKQVLSLLDTFFEFYDVSFLKLLKLLVDVVMLNQIQAQ